MENNKHLSLTTQQALIKAANYCAYQERCHQEVKAKLREWGLHEFEALQIIDQLIEQQYLNEERFAKSFAGGKFRVKQWGRVKIKLELKYRDISEYCIASALREINEEEYLKTLDELLEKKWAEIKENNLLTKRAKVARYAISKGFEQQLVWEQLTSGNKHH